MSQGRVAACHRVSILSNVTAVMKSRVWKHQQGRLTQCGSEGISLTYRLATLIDPVEAILQCQLMQTGEDPP